MIPCKKKAFAIPFTATNFQNGYSYEFEGRQINNIEELERLYIEKGATEMYVRIATVVMTPNACARYFNCMKANGYAIDTAGISFYPSAPSMYVNSMTLFKKSVMTINKKCGIPVFIGEFSYPSGEMSGAFAGWNKKAKGYDNSEEGQAAIYRDVTEWGKTHGVVGIRYWAADYEDWSTMGLFKFEDKHGVAKAALLEEQ